MKPREISWTLERQELLTAVESGEMAWKNPCGLGGYYLRRGVHILSPTLRLLKEAGALAHDFLPGPVRLTADGQRLLTKWRGRAI